MTGRLLAGILFLATLGASVWGAEYGPQNHVGAAFTLQSGDVVYGLHENIGTLTIPSGATVTVRAYQSSVAGSGYVEFHAQSIEMANAILSATGKGHEGGAGGGGGGGGALIQAGSAGGPGSPSRDGGGAGWGEPGQVYAQGGGSGGSGGAGGGTYGGSSGFGGYGRITSAGETGEPGLDGEYKTPADASTDQNLERGSGGGGGGGGGGGNSGYIDVGGGGGGGGAAGGSGGGYVKLYASASIHATGAQILTRGATSANGGAGGEGWYNIYLGSIGGNGASGGSSNGSGSSAGGLGGWGEYYGGNGGNGGKGAGGGILLYCDAAAGISLTGATLDARDGNSATTHGGTVKVFHSGADPTTGATIQAGRTYKNGSLIPDTEDPTYAGASGIQSVDFTVPGDDSEYLVTWAEATDNVTSASLIRYNVYASADPAHVFDGSPVQTFTGATSGGIDAALVGPHGIYWFGVRAMDLSGNEEDNTVVLEGPMISGVSPKAWMIYE